MAPSGRFCRAIPRDSARAAAKEMKERIAKKLDELIAFGEGDITHLKKQKVLLTRAMISTVHSFCSDLVKENFHSLDISPNFRIGDENELTILCNEALEDTLETLYSEFTDDFKELADCFTRPLHPSVFSILISKLGIYSI